MLEISSSMRIFSMSLNVKCFDRRLGTAPESCDARLSGRCWTFTTTLLPELRFFAALAKPRGSCNLCCVSSAMRCLRASLACCTCWPSWEAVGMRPPFGTSDGPVDAAEELLAVVGGCSFIASATLVKASRTRRKPSDVLGSATHTIAASSPASVSSKPASLNKSSAGAWQPTSRWKRALPSRNRFTVLSSGLSAMRCKMEDMVVTQRAMSCSGKESNPAKPSSSIASKSPLFAAPSGNSSSGHAAAEGSASTSMPSALTSLLLIDSISALSWSSEKDVRGSKLVMAVGVDGSALHICTNASTARSASCSREKLGFARKSSERAPWTVSCGRLGNIFARRAAMSLTPSLLFCS
mmetsp:Transcript_30012/g.69885  ORF Transcript_30012/g.69885 Transcript_30012/m.69885 type:complete len:353 (-) Transcript_30012:190-1248(-)